ncbi:hypothetical protein KR009_001991 [Drosophila setifemur]|nr:hypothetical protein KR009_001991 [Drosophila setifemur]
MADEKHRMLYQGQDPAGNPPQSPRPLSLSPSEPPTYDDAMAPEQSQPNFGYNSDRRRAIYGEPHHMRCRVEEFSYSMEEVYFDRQEPPLNPIQEQEEPENADQPAGEPQPERFPMPKVRDFFAIAPQPKLGPEAVDIMCPACGQNGYTQVRRTHNPRANAWATWLCLMGWCCCACVCPYFFKSCRTTSHYCSACEIYLGSYYPPKFCQ